MTRIELNKVNNKWLLTKISPKVEYVEFDFCNTLIKWFDILSQKEKFIYLDLSNNKINGGGHMILLPNKVKENQTNYLVGGFNLVVNLNPLVDIIWNYSPDILYFRRHL